MNEYFRGTDASDPGLHTGLMYYVEQKGYRAHLRKHVTQKDISTCSGFQTLAHAETKVLTGMHSTGVVMCLCAHHEMIRPLGVGDLQKGERYCNVDYAVLSGIQGLQNLPSLFFSYDIACQWCIKLYECMEELPNLGIPPRCRLDFGVHKCHCSGHKRQCQCQFSMNVKPGVAQMDGEGIEHTWSEVNKAAGSTKVMGPGHHHDMLDNIFGDHNYRKLIRDIHDCQTAEVEAWEQDNTASNPYLESVEHVSEAQVQLDLIKEEDEEAVSGTPELDETSVSGCLSMGFLIEEEQRRVRWLAAKKDLEFMPELALSVENKHKHIVHRIKLFCKLQASYMPGVSCIIAGDRQEKTLAENLPLWLPSELDARVQAQGCLAGIAKKEEQLQEAQCTDALDRPMGQKYATRAATTVQRLQDQCELAVDKYQLKQADLTYVGSIFTIEEGKKTNKKRKKKWKKKEPHIIFMQPEDGKKVTSWIWRMEGALGDGSDDDLMQAAHLEWLKSRAWMHRWHEEVAMVEREKERVQLGLEHMTKQWEGRIGQHMGLDSTLSEGMTADIWMGSVDVPDEEVHEEDPLSARSVHPSYIARNIDSSGPSEMEGGSSDLGLATESDPSLSDKSGSSGSEGDVAEA
ncbi:uncharacterized protein ARMOST_03170 [Armillaria ostoyae]|uniref:CxC2-like cysteine cluster KDZ transposase-associated domain-containing protein n=1 Tax=Armillaria ostoyae TaxID=47428 RepID=A0A284QTT7_ARMOS|nr:uncharacterized protein ARMOST_03170 [Armillaria ostoyae]